VICRYRAGMEFQKPRSVGIGIGIEIAIDGHSEIYADSDPDTDPGVSRYQLYFSEQSLTRLSRTL
jgi:hypothetical protein